jgi:hypothetical protein
VIYAYGDYLRGDESRSVGRRHGETARTMWMLRARESCHLVLLDPFANLEAAGLRR